MHLRSGLIVIGTALAGLASAPLAGQTAPNSPAGQVKPAKDMNEMVCERQRELGSRLASAKVCHTRAEWAELRSQDRQEIELVQQRRGTQGR